MSFGHGSIPTEKCSLGFKVKTVNTSAQYFPMTLIAAGIVLPCRPSTYFNRLRTKHSFSND